MKKDITNEFKGAKDKHLRVYYNSDTQCYEVISTYEKHIFYNKGTTAFLTVQHFIDDWFE